ncbi:uncharacterized protein K452DRAFT_35200 [Aplosporella prunicola CBS 121167]|uniref:Uncharacterized protein n=1 Tax=Aplosporella prunicola CBS 121167 TaxID=1176127 RepID=A0A6A6BF82_9PEZI|nr:uncharacterized protein K452DRAFT_35200 [Aplosporella prunicola CBS 121167]KAF2141904.1 hypothetical protein K452DRAFT_35200 [Aplosporella prunicola CBS 121167]
MEPVTHSESSSESDTESSDSEGDPSSESKSDTESSDSEDESSSAKASTKLKYTKQPEPSSGSDSESTTDSGSSTESSDSGDDSAALSPQDLSNSATPITELLCAGRWETQSGPMTAYVSLLRRANDHSKLKQYLVALCKTKDLTAHVLREKLTSIRQLMRKHVKSGLRSIVIANLPCFPELIQCPFVFLTMVPDTTPCLDLLCRGGPKLKDGNFDCVAHGIVQTLQRKSDSKSGIFKLHNGYRRYTLSLCFEDEIVAVVRRCSKLHTQSSAIETRLRPLVLMNRSFFPELKGTVLVRTWENLTGLKW